MPYPGTTSNFIKCEKDFTRKKYILLQKKDKPNSNIKPKELIHEREETNILQQPKVPCILE
jgi:hypothetical protein